MTYYHSNSVACTADCETVFGESRPYLVSVSSPSDPSAEYYHSQISYPLATFVALVNAAYPRAKLTLRNVQSETLVAERGSDGRVSKLVLGNERLSGVQARELFELKSADFTVTVDKEKVTFEVLGSGHGVGMSQVGANVLAKQGMTYREILAHYYPGTTESDI